MLPLNRGSCNEADNSIFSFIRHGKKPEDVMIVVLNADSLVRSEYRMGSVAERLPRSSKHRFRHRWWFERGEWVAFSPNLSRILASTIAHPDPASTRSHLPEVETRLKPAISVFENVPWIRAGRHWSGRSGLLAANDYAAGLLDRSAPGAQGGRRALQKAV